MNVKIANAPIPGLMIGNAIFINVLTSPQPSILADSSNSVGIACENCLIKNTPNGQPTAGRINA